MLTQQNLALVAEGMEVYDRDGNRIGTVKAFRQGEGTIRTSDTDIVTMATAIHEALGTKKDLPTILYSRLYDEGFVCVERGFLRSKALVFPRQINDIGANAIFLGVDLDELVKI